MADLPSDHGPNKSLTIEARQVPSGTEILISGPLITQHIGNAAQQIRTLLDTTHTPTVWVNLAGLTDLDHYGVTVLLNAHRHASTRGLAFAVGNVPPTLRARFTDAETAALMLGTNRPASGRPSGSR